MNPNDWAEFEKHINHIADAYAKSAKDKYDHTPSHVISSDLKILDRAITTALQRLSVLNLEHVYRQDALVNPYNYPVTRILHIARVTLFSQKYGGLPPNATEYPSDVISALRELRDVARMAIEIESPGRGNNPRRNSKSARRMDLASDFVFWYRARFSEMPPMSKTGRVVDLLQSMLNRAGEGDDADAGELLRQAIEADKVGCEMLPRARKATSVKRPK